MYGVTAVPHGLGAGAWATSVMQREPIARASADTRNANTFHESTSPETIRVAPREVKLNHRQLSSHMRAMARSELADERAADEMAARIYHERTRSLSEALAALTSVAAHVTAYLPEASWTGILAHVAGDLATLRLHAGGEAHLQVGPGSLLRVHRMAHGSPAADVAGPQTFIARLRQLELEAHPVTLVGRSGQVRVAGTLRAVATDHVVVECEGDTWLVPVPAIALAITAPPGTGGVC